MTNPELLHRGAQVQSHDALADAELVRDQLVRVAERREAHDLLLAQRQTTRSDGCNKAPALELGPDAAIDEQVAWTSAPPDVGDPEDGALRFTLLGAPAGATIDEATGRAAVFLVNRSLSDALTIEVDVAGLAVSEVLEAVGIHDEDVYAKNTFEDRERVGLTENASAALADGTLTITLPPVSWTAVSLG